MHQGALAAGAALERAGEVAGDDDAQGRDGIGDVALRPERGIRGVGNLRVGEALC